MKENIHSNFIRQQPKTGNTMAINIKMRHIIIFFTGWNTTHQLKKQKLTDAVVGVDSRRCNGVPDIKEYLLYDSIYKSRLGRTKTW